MNISNKLNWPTKVKTSTQVDRYIDIQQRLFWYKDNITM